MDGRSQQWVLNLSEEEEEEGDDYHEDKYADDHNNEKNNDNVQINHINNPDADYA